jgi:hypothetical protein
MVTYLIISSIVFFLLAVVWKTSDITNTLIKVSLFILALVGFVFVLEVMGHIVKV